MASELSKREEPAIPTSPSQCPVEDWLTFLGHKWSALILWRLSDRDHGFSDLMDALPGITAKVLTDRLAGFVERGLIVRSSASTFPRRTTYALTDMGREVSAMLQKVYDWAR